MTEALKHLTDKNKIIVLDGDRIRPIDEILSGLRFLIDEPEKQKPKKAQEKAPEEEKKKSTGVSKEQEILKAWNGGERSIKEIMEMTGASYATVRRWISVTPEG